MSKSLVLGIDVGTSATKVAVMGADGTLLAQAREAYPTLSPHPGWAEQHAGDWWAAVVNATNEVMAGQDQESIAAIGLSNAGGTMVALKDTGRPAYPALLWMDTRAAKQGESYLSDRGPDFWLNRLGYTVIAFTPSMRLAWLKEHEPDVFHNIWRVLQPADYIIYRMTGKVVTDRSNACATGFYNLHTREWDPEILSMVGMSDRLLPELHDSGAIAGYLSPDSGQELGVSPGAPVVLGAWDQACALVGAGCVAGQDALLSAGTAWTLAQPIQGMRIDESGRALSLQHARGGESVLMLAMSNGGAVVEWYRRVFAGVASSEYADASSGDAQLRGLPSGVEHVPPGSDGVLALPHFLGAMGIHMEPEYSACLLGLRHGTERAEVFRAILEAVAYELRWSLEVLLELGITAPRLLMVGGATRSSVWPQIVCDVTGRQVLLPFVTECAVLGAARMAREAVGLETAPADEANGIDRHLTPNPEAVAMYHRCYATYKRAHRSLKALMGDLAELRT